MEGEDILDGARGTQPSEQPKPLQKIKMKANASATPLAKKDMVWKRSYSSRVIEELIDTKQWYVHTNRA